MCNNFNQVIEAQKLTISNTTIKQNQENLEPNTSYKYNTVADGAIEQMWKNLEKFREVVKTNQQEIVPEFPYEYIYIYIYKYILGPREGASREHYQETGG